MKHLTTVIQFLFLASIFWIFWTPGLKVAADFHTATAANLAANIYPFTWRDSIVASGLGEYTVNVLWSQPLHALFGVLSLTNIPFEAVEKILGLLCLSLAFFGIKKLLIFLKVGFWGVVVGTFFYLTNTFFILLFDGGQLPLALGYGVLPLTILYFLKNSIWLSFWLVILSILDIRLIYISAIIFLIYFIYSLVFFKKEIKFKNLIYSLMFSVVVLAGIHAYWLLPAFISKSPQLPTTYERSAQVDTLSFSTILHSILLQQPHWYKNIFGQVGLPQAEFVFIPVLVFLAPFLKRKDRVVGFWLVIALVGIFLSKGSQQPFTGVYPWLFTHIPGFFLFRDPVKFYFLSVLAFTVLISFTIDRLILHRLTRWLPIVIVVYFIWLIRPVYSDQMTGMFSFPVYQKEYSELTDILVKDKNPSIIFWIPMKYPLGFSNNQHPSVDAIGLGQKRPFVVGIKGTYETLNFLREAPYMGEIFDVSGIGYIADPYLDPRRDNMHSDNIKYYDLFLDQLSKLPWLSKIDSSPIPLLKTKSHQEKFFITPNIWWIVGSDDIYNESTKSADLKLSRNALIFSEEHPGLGEKISEIPQAKIVLNNKTMIDLAAAFMKNNSLIFPAKQLDFAPAKSGWWKREAADLVGWRAFLQTKYGIDNQDFDLGGGWAVGEGKRKFTIYNLQFTKGKVLLARVLESTRSGSLSFSQNSKLISQIDTKKPGNHIRWFEVGELKSGGELEISSSGDINVVNTLAVLDKNEWLSYQDKAKSLQGRIVSFDEKNAKSDNNPKVSYNKINPTKYTVNISGLTKPALLVFSQNYDGLWKMNNQPSLPVYSLLDGFEVEKNGQYVIEFEPQKYVFPGLVISVITVFSLLLLLIRSSKKL